MEDIYAEMMAVSREIADSFPCPRFYTCCSQGIRLSRSLFSQDKKVLRCRAVVQRALRNNYGHGLDHAEKVAVEAGALAYIEGQRILPLESSRHQAGVLAQISGLLHDLRREEKDHARSGAAAAGKILKDFSFPVEDEQMIVEAIFNHEAFVEPKRIDSPVGQMVSDVLYDADKFRWGPDNFTLTLWEMLRFSRGPVVRLIRRFPKGMNGIARIKDTFRTETGRAYGPEFIDLGLEIGEKIYLFMQKRFASELEDKKTG
jgi:hypothetical protein